MTSASTFSENEYAENKSLEKYWNDSIGGYIFINHNDFD